MTRRMRRSRLAMFALVLGVVLQIPACQPETVQAFVEDFLREALAAWVL
jgi:hypothetical protein